MNTMSRSGFRSAQLPVRAVESTCMLERWPVFVPATAELTGKERDQETGLDFFGARYLSSAQRRWTIPDWLARGEAVPYARPTDPQTLNLYAYLRNNPLGGVDPDGHAQYCNNKAQCGYDDGNKDGKVFVVFNKKQYNAIVKAQKVSGPVSSAVLMLGSAARQAVQASVTATGQQGGKDGSDTRGGYHEEGGVWGTNSAGAQTPVAAKPGPAALPSQSGAHMDILDTADPAALASVKDNIQGGWHVHPAGKAYDTSAHLMGFGQNPSPGDQANALPGRTNLVVGTGSGEVTFFNGSNANIGQMTLTDFMNLPQ